jgi:transcriptional regulator with XRE-family HTH domain
MNYAELTKLARGERSIREFARQAGISASYIVGIEQSKYEPTLQILVKICDASCNRVRIADFVGNDVTNKAEKLYDFCMKLLKDENEKELIRMYYESL